MSEKKHSRNIIDITIILIIIASFCLGYGTTGDIRVGLMWTGYTIISILIGTALALIPFAGALIFWFLVLPWIGSVTGVNSQQILPVNIMIMIEVTITNIIATLMALDYILESFIRK